MRRLVVTIVSVLLVMFCIAGCQSALRPPSMEKVQSQFLNNQDDILTVTEYLCNSDCDSIIIRKGERNAWADGNAVDIDDIDVRNAATRLLQHYQCITKSGNTIHLTQWIRGNDVGCGVAYSINGVDTPEIEFLTHIEQIPGTDWCYYIDDYNEWRSQRRQSPN